MILTLSDDSSQITHSPLRSKFFRWSKAAVAVCAFPLCLIGTDTAAASIQAAPIHRATQQIKDAAGRIQVIVDFDFNADTDPEFDDTIANDVAAKWPGQRPRSIKFLNQIEQKYGFTRNGMTSWTNTSLTAFVAPDRIAELAKDKRVVLITENEEQSFSAFYQATDSFTSGESYSWGWKVTSTDSVPNTTPIIAPSASQQRVYIIDSGVANHDDLNVVTRTNVACLTGVENCSTGLSNDQYPVVGCYPHATHVAGIIGATASNFKTNIGVYAGVKIVSVGVNTADGAIVGNCANVTFTTATIASALDWVRKAALMRVAIGDTQVPIVNMSLNTGSVGFDRFGVAETNRARLLSLVTPMQHVCAAYGYWENKACQFVDYPGAFFVQAAGNQAAVLNANESGTGSDVCQSTNGIRSWAYQHAFPNNNTTNPSDGIMVIGAIHSDGAPVDSLPNGRRFDAPVPAGIAGTPTSSNYGGCLDAWAPGNRIYSTWCDQLPSNSASCVVNPPNPYSGNGQIGSQGWAFLSGTSMAAPHVAGAAAYLADSMSLTTPAAIETAVRARLFPTGFNDNSGSPVNIVQVP